MSSAQVGAVLRHIRKLAASRKDHEFPDHQLLELFARHRDEAAFAALLRRHGGMVLSVCRSVLHDLHDAEDAFQAAFLLLAQKADSIHRREAVSGWLYRVAYHAAVRARANAARRRVLERRAVTMPSADPVLDLSLREVRATLLEELEGLPETYRGPLVLCGLEEKSLDEAARLLGWSKWTVKGRLQRGRELLRGRLRRRGIELPAALAATALALNSSSGRVSAALADSTLRAAMKVAVGGGVVTGAASAGVAGLVQGVSKSMFRNKAKAMIVFIMALGMGAGGLAAARHAALAAPAHGEEAQDTPPRAPDSGKRTPSVPRKDEAGAPIEVSGRVLDPEGKPVAGADLYMGVPAEHGHDLKKMAASDANGRFAFMAVKSGGASKPVVIAVAKGYGADWIGMDEAKGEFGLRLVKDLPIEGRILDTDGKPVAGAKVRIAGISGFTGENADTFLADIQTGQNVGDAGNGVGPKHWEGPLPGQDEAATTNNEGRFRLTGIGRERHVRLHVAGPAIQHDYLQAVTRDTKPVSVPGPFRVKIYGANLDFVAAAGRSVRGVVRAKATGKPLADVVVSGGGTTFSVHTDKEGRFEVQGCPKSEKYQVAAAPGDGQPYLGGRKEVDDTPGLEPLNADIELVSGIRLKGHLTDKDTGKAVPGARVAYYPVVPNPFTLNVAYDPGRGASWATTAADGSFHLAVLPGPGMLTVSCPQGNPYMAAFVPAKEMREFFKGRDIRRPDDRFIEVQQGGNGAYAVFQEYHQAIALIDPGEKGTALEKDVTVQRGKTLTGTVAGPDGTPLEGVTLDGKALAGGKFTLNNLNPRRPRGLYFLQKDKGLGLYTEALTDEDKPVTVRLQPCGSAVGRLLDEDGQPLAGEVVRIRGIADMKTDKNGKFRVDHLVVGFTYDIRNAALFARYFDEFMIEPGKVKDLGEKKINK